MAYATPKEIVDDYLAALRAWGVGTLTSVDDGGHCVFRKGPQTSFKRGVDVQEIVVVSWAGMPEGEASAGSGNVWNHPDQLAISLLVPYGAGSATATEASYDLFLELVGEFKNFQSAMEQRHLGGNAQVAHIKSAVAFLDSFFPSDPDDLFWICPVIMQYRMRKVGS